MTNDQSFKTLVPSFGRTFFCVLRQLLIVTALAALYERHRNGHWWSFGYCASLIIPFLIVPVVVYFAFVPRRIEWSRTACHVLLRLDGTQSLPWTKLSHYGDGNNVFYLTFEGVRRFQIFAGAFPRDDWNDFLAFLRSNYPLAKTSWLVRAIWGSRVA